MFLVFILGFFINFRLNLSLFRFFSYCGILFYIRLFKNNLNLFFLFESKKIILIKELKFWIVKLVEFGI